ncbi:MAG: IS200/IS605 family transposase [Anaerolineae bacterium]|nr:IS200/IS605 family transposase [Anaerolineae bacterium]
MPLTRLFYHFVWTTKKRLPFITQHNRTAIYDAIRGKVEGLGGMVLAINGMDEHVHLVAHMPAKYSVVEFMRQIKGVSSHVASHFANDYEPFAWQEEYGAHTVSESHLPQVIKYVELQQEHHTLKTLNPRLEFGEPTT